MAGNNVAARWANAAVQAHSVEGGSETDDQASAVLLMCSLRHLCDAQGWDHGAMQKEAHEIYMHEREANGPATSDFAEKDSF